jgi:hypothetical protein
VSVLQEKIIFFIMKRLFLWMICWVLWFAPVTEAALGSKGLIVNGGRDVVLCRGEERRIFVRDGFWEYPVLRGLTFTSENPLVFTVGLRSGVVRANGVGSARLFVIDRHGNCGQITVTVNGRKKLSLWWLLFPPVLFLLCCVKQLKHLLRKK